MDGSSQKHTVDNEIVSKFLHKSPKQQCCTVSARAITPELNTVTAIGYGDLTNS